MLIDWDEIEEFHVTKALRKICYKWWCLDIKFYDEFSVCTGDNITFQNHFCRLLHSAANSAKKCRQDSKKHLRLFKKHKKSFIYKCHAGLQGIVIPMFVKGEYVGAMVASGVLISRTKDPRLKMYAANLVKLGFDRMTLEKCYNKIQRIDGDSEKYLIDLLELTAEDIMSYYNMTHEKEEEIKEQNAIQKSYNNKYKGIIGTSSAIKEIFDTLDLVENSESTVLLEGESGTGKELLAAAIHRNGSRRDKMFVVQNCSAFSETLLSSELFGHQKGSFTGAVSDKAGLFEIADGGTFFLDEIAEMNLDVQAKILRVLQDGTFYRVGGTEQKKVDVRIIVATNKDLSKWVEQGLFRKDLFYRINTIHITLPLLSERKEDIVLLTDYFLKSYAKTHNQKKKQLSPKTIDRLMAYSWPGNIRELENTIERLIVLSGNNKTIVPEHLPIKLKATTSKRRFFENMKESKDKLRNILKSYEMEIITEVLKKTEWNKTVASKELGISHACLRNKIEQFRISKQIL